ncbi:Arm DNA-binding domain-containing protein [Dyadobacter sp. OTU695]|uniref:Arm DNA-binding domain-containing protein n=1 Tax=Dyadobacter sp. OTU695 TaxID=3043860 RepID=UPI00313D6C89
MLSRNLTTLFYLKKRSGYVKGPLPIYLRITTNGERFEISTKRECEPEKWNSVTGRKNGTREDARVLNSYLDAMQLKVYDIQKQMLEANIDLSAEKLRNRINGVSDKSKDILEIFRDHNEKLARMVGTDYALGTLGRYKTSFDHTKAFIEWKYKTTEFDITKLDYDFISEYAYGHEIDDWSALFLTETQEHFQSLEIRVGKSIAAIDRATLELKGRKRFLQFQDRSQALFYGLGVSAPYSVAGIIIAVLFYVLIRHGQQYAERQRILDEYQTAPAYKQIMEQGKIVEYDKMLYLQLMPLPKKGKVQIGEHYIYDSQGKRVLVPLGAE